MPTFRVFSLSFEFFFLSFFRLEFFFRTSKKEVCVNVIIGIIYFLVECIFCVQSSFEWNFLTTFIFCKKISGICQNLEIWPTSLQTLCFQRALQKSLQGVYWREPSKQCFLSVTLILQCTGLAKSSSMKKYDDLNASKLKIWWPKHF